MKTNPAQPGNANFIKYLSLVLLIFQTTGLVLVMRYSRTTTVKDDDGKDVRYLSSTAVVCAEVMKLITCVILIWYQSGTHLTLNFQTKAA